MATLERLDVEVNVRKEFEGTWSDGARMSAFGTKRTYRDVRYLSPSGVKQTTFAHPELFRFRPKADMRSEVKPAGAGAIGPQSKYLAQSNKSWTGQSLIFD